MNRLALIALVCAVLLLAPIAFVLGVISIVQIFRRKEQGLVLAVMAVLISLMVVAFIGAWIGQRLVRRVSAVIFRRLVMVMLAVMGVKMAVEGWHGLG